MKLRWFGHSCFYIESEEGTRLITDPFDKTVGYNMPDIEADIVTISHNHYDHNYAAGIKGRFETVNRPGRHEFKDIRIKGIKTFHDDANGQKRGQNVVFNITIDRINTCHMGDLGHVPDNEQIKDIGKVDILMVPVGGTFTVAAEKAGEIVELFNPDIVIPIHYKTPSMNFNIAGVEPFLDVMGDRRHMNLKTLEINMDNMKEYRDSVITFDYQ